MTDNPLAGHALRYLIGADAPGPGGENIVTVVAWDVDARAKAGISAGYCNLFREDASPAYGPYLKPDAVAAHYHEGQIDPNGPGWEKNLREQFDRRRAHGFQYVELDNPDAYALQDVLGAVELAEKYGLKALAKNPGLLDPRDATAFLAHRNVFGAIVEQGAGGPSDMDRMRRQAGKHSLPVWFVFFGHGRAAAERVGHVIATAHIPEMHVTYASVGEYGNALAV